MDISRDERPSLLGPTLLGPTLIGTGLQLVMVLAGHFRPEVAQFFAPGGMAISALAGALAALGSRPASLGSAAAGGVVAGGVCAFVGILVSYVLGDVQQATVLAYGTAGSAVTGAIGGLVGKVLSARAAQRV